MISYRAYKAHSKNRYNLINFSKLYITISQIYAQQIRICYLTEDLLVLIKLVL